MADQTLSAIWLQSYAPAEAERGKFVPIDANVIPDYELSGGRGKYAVLTYQVNSPPISLSAGSITIGGNISASIANWGEMPLVTTVSSIPILNNTSIVSSGYFSTSATILTFNPAIRYIEVFNNSNNTAYLMFGSVTYDTLSSMGLILFANSFYNIERSISNVTLGANGSSTNLRVIGHYIV